MKTMQVLILSGFFLCVGEGKASFGSEGERQVVPLPAYMPPPQIEEDEDEDGGVFMEENPEVMAVANIRAQYQHYYESPNFWKRERPIPSQEELFGY